MNVYRRHNPAKCKYTSRLEYRCKCPIWVDGRKNGRRINEALKLRDWNRANELVRRWELVDQKPSKQQPVTIESWRDQFLQDAAARSFSTGTMRLYKLLFRQLIAFAADYRITLANCMDLNALTKFRSTWLVAPRTATKKLERLRSIYKFAVQRKLVNENYALALVAPKAKPTPTLAFPKDDEVKILWAAESPKVDPRVKAFILTMRYFGLRISDVATLAVDNLNGNRLTLYQAKTGEHVSVLIPSDVTKALLAVKGTRTRSISFGAAHQRFLRSRDFGVRESPKSSSLQQSPMATPTGSAIRARSPCSTSTSASKMLVSRLLGHQSVRVTEKHYSP